MGDTSQHNFQNQENTTVGDSSQHTLGYRNSETPMGDTSQHNFQNQENTTMSVIQVNILLDEAIQ